MRTRTLICTTWCAQYTTEAMFYLTDELPGQRGLVVEYAKGGFRGESREFGTAIPNDWTDDDVLEIIHLRMKSPTAPYAPWEVPARAFGSPELFRFWNGEEPT